MIKRIFPAALLLFLCILGVLWLRPDPEKLARPDNPLHRESTGAAVTASTASPVSNVTPASRAPSDAPERPAEFVAFENWAEKIVTAKPDDTLLVEGEELARQRRARLYELIKSDPEAAIAAAVPMRLRTQLSERIQALLEERISGRGQYAVYIATDFEKGKSEVSREFTLNGRRMDAFVYGPMSQKPTTPNQAAWGIAIDGRVALYSNPVRRFERGEPLPTSFARNTCPVSQRLVTVTSSEQVVEVAGRSPEPICQPAHIDLLEQSLAGDTGEGSTGDLPPTARDSWSQGPKTMLVMRAIFPDDPTEPITEDGAYAMMDGVNQFFIENSYDSTSISTIVTPLLMLPQTKAWYSEQGTGALMSDARQAARDVGLETDNFDWDIVRFTSVPGFNFGGLASVRGKSIWLQSSSVGVAAHELGHNYGVWHANFWNASGDSVIGPGAHVEYGNSYDTMGAASAGNNQFNAAFKAQLDWLTPNFVQTVTTSGTYRIYTFDIPGITSGRNYAIKVRKDYDRNYWLEFRQKFAGNRWFLNGVHLNWDPWNNGVINSGSGTHLLDTMPGSAAGKDDSPVIIGRTFSDMGAGLHITPVARGNGSPENWIDVTIKIGTFDTNRPPAASIIADRTSVAANSPVNFTATANDPDGDALAYWWDFGDDTFGQNSPNASKSWATSGNYTVRCTVSDMKGGVHVRKVTITVGSPTSFTLSGTVTTPSGAPLEGVRVYNGLTGSSYRGTYTDSEGNYTIGNVAAGNVNLQAAKYGYNLTPTGWTVPVTVGPSAGNLDWTAEPGTTVGFTITDAVASEAGLNPGTIRLWRTGETNVPFAVKLNRTGTAGLNTDYTLNPAPSGSPLQLTIPAGAPYLDVRVQPISDAQSEGPETVIFTLIEDPAYAIGSLAEVILTIADDEAAGIPLVDVSASTPSGPADNLAPESGSDSGVFTFTRSNGSVAGELAVFYSVSGTAVADTDYEALSGVVTIPAGETVAVVPFRVIDDANVEFNESVIVTVLANAAYTGAGDNTTIMIVDDDPTTVTITATDDTSREAGSSTGTFTVSRQGFLGANLVVNYALSGSALNTADYATLSGSVTLLAGRATASITVTPVNDALLEGEETVVASLVSSAAYNVGNPGTATMTLIDDELPAITLATGTASTTEGSATPGSWSFTRTGSTAAPLTVFFSVGGTARSGADFAPLPPSIEIPAGTNRVFLNVLAINDTVAEPSERIQIVLEPRPEYALTTIAPIAVTVLDNDTGLPGVGFTFATSSGPENDTTAQVSVGLTAASAATVTVNYTVTGGTATGSGTDYTLAAGTLSFPADTIVRALPITIANDTAVESDETIIITLSAPSGAVLDAFTTHTFTIRDDDGSGTISVSAADSIATEQGATTGTFRISRNGSTAKEQLVNFHVVGTASAPSDYLPLGTSVTIPIGATFADITVTAVDDSTDETNETVILNLTSAPGGKFGTDLATILIADNDDSSTLPVVTVVASDELASEPSSDTGAFTISRTGPTDQPLPVTFSITGTAGSGVDFNAIGTSATIPAGASETIVLVTPRDDTAFETNETVVLSLTIVPSYRVETPSVATVILQDNEAGVSITSSGSSTEDGSTTGSFIVTRTGSTDTPLNVNFTVAGSASGGDYASVGTSVLIPAGTNSAVINVTPVNDAQAEGSETVVLTLATGSGYTVVSPTSATVVILDDEPAINIVANDPSAYEGGGNPGAILITRSGRTNDSLNVSLLVEGTAQNGVDYTAISSSVTFVPGQIAIPLAITPINDASVEGDETVLVTVQANPAYAVLAPASALVTIADDEINLVPTVNITSPTADLVHLPNNQVRLILEASATDDGKPSPPGALSLHWTLVSGPASVLFSETNSANTVARFPTSGTYVLRVAASDGQLSASDEVTVIVNLSGVLASGLQAHWSFNETSGNTAFDASGRNRNATLANGAAFRPGRFGLGLELDGVDDVATFSSLALTQLTVSAWIRSDAQGDSTTPRVISMPAFNVRIRRDTSSTTNAVALESFRSGTDSEWRSPGNVVADGSWFHIVVTYDSSNPDNDPLFYIDGVLQPTSNRARGTGAPDSNIGTGYIGNVVALDRSFDGNIDEMRLYSRILNASEIALLAAGPPTNIAPNVDAGLQQSIPLASEAILEGSMTDDGLPNPPGEVTLEWMKVSGPGTVEFSNPDALTTSAQFSDGGVYVLRLIANDGEVKTADDVTVQVIAPTTVTLIANDIPSHEFSTGSIGGGSGMFILRRAGDTIAALPVQLAISGTASNGVDYQTIASVVTIPAGQTSVVIAVSALRDTLPEGEEMVALEIVPDAAYIVGSPAYAEVVIEDLPWDNWRFGWFSQAQLQNPNISGELADPDFDGLPNILEYAYGFTPFGADDPSSGFSGAIETLPAPNASEAYVVRFRRLRPGHDLLYEVEVSTNLSTWFSGGNAGREILPPIDNGDPWAVTVRYQIFGSLTQPGGRYVRLKVTRL